MKLRIIFFVAFLISHEIFSQNFEKDWSRIEGKINSVTALQMKEVEDFNLKYASELDKRPDQAMRFYSLYAYKNWEKKDMEKAGENFIKSYQYALKANDTTLKYTAIYRLGDFYKGSGNYQEAEKYYYYCMRPLSVILGQSSREYTQIFYEYTQVLIALGKYEAAKPYIDGLIYYYKTLDGENNLNYLMLNNYKAMIMQGTGDYKSSIEIFSWLVNDNRFLQLGDTGMHITALNNLGNVLRESGNFEEATFILKKGKQEYYRLKLSDKSELASLENNLGLCYKALGKVQEAEDAYNAAIVIHQEKNFRDMEAYCTLLNNKGDLLRELGRLGEASELLQQSIQLRKQNFGEENVKYANALSNLAIVYFDAGFFQQALEKNIQAEQIYLKTVGDAHQAYANCLNNLSICYLHFKDYQKAENCKLRALSIIEHAVGKDHFRYASYLISTCGLYFQTHQIEKAEKNLKEALPLIEKNLGERHDLYAHAQLLLAEIYSQSKRMDQAIPLYMECMDHYRSLLNKYFDGMTEEQQAHYLGLISPMFGSYNLFVMNYQKAFPAKNIDLFVKKSLENQLLLKGLLNNRSSRIRQQIMASGDLKLIELYKQWADAQNQLINHFKNNTEETENNALVAKINSIEKEIKSRAKDFGKTQVADFETLKMGLAVDEAALEFFKVNETVNDTDYVARYGVLIMKKNSKAPELVTFQRGDLLDGLYYDNYSKCIDNQWNDTLSYEAYFKPFAKKLEGIKKLCVSAEGIFHKISLAGLYDSKKKKFVNDEMLVYYTSNLSSLNAKEQKNSAPGKAVLFGFPDYEYDFEHQKTSNTKNSTVAVAKRFGFSNLPELPGTKTEVEKIEKELKGKNWEVEVFMKQNASEENLRKVNAPKILHIATHGYYLKDVECEDKSFLGFETSNFKNLSLLRSGIILAGAGPASNDSLRRKSENDGIVTAMEASLLNLYNTELVVLSACQTGLGDDNGSQGVGGLQRSFAIAGARHIVMSLWPVDDQATQELMSTFYEDYSVSGSVEDSFNKAKNKVKEKFKHPYYWAAFVLLKTFQ